MTKIYVVEHEKYVELSNGKSFFREINYSTVKESYTVKKFDNLNDAKEFYSDIKFNLKIGEGYSLSVIYHDDKSDDWYYETLNVFNYQDLQNEKKYELHYVYLDNLENKDDFINNIKTRRFYREDAQEVSFDNNFSLNQYYISDDELIIIIKRLNCDDFEIVDIIKN